MTRQGGTILGGAVLFALVAAAPPPAADPADEAAIRETVQFYFDGGRLGDSATMARAFHVGVAHMLYVRDGKLVDVPIPEFVARTERKHAPGFTPDTFPRRVVLVDIAGTSAVAKLETRRPDMLIVDYMSLLKIDGRWQIVNKVFDRVPR
jgi:hypothetical protein